jgi:hypothetical protein
MGRSVIGGTVTVVTECNFGSNSLVVLLGGTGRREKYLVEKEIIEIKIIKGGIFTWLNCRVKITNLVLDRSSIELQFRKRESGCKNKRTICS